MSRPTISYSDDDLPPDLQRLSKAYLQSERRPGERSVLEIMRALKWPRGKVQGMLDAAMEQGLWERREGMPSGRKGYWYREVDSGQSVRAAQADPGVHERAGRGGVFTDLEPADRGGGRTRRAGKARQARGGEAK